MSDTTQATSTRNDARAFADAFAAADDAFTFGATQAESRTLTLEELADAIALDRPLRPSAPGVAAKPSAVRPAPAPAPAPAGAHDDALLTLEELSEALAAPVREDIPDFDFGTSAHERARRRTAARLDASPSARRRISGPVNPGARSRRPDRRSAERAPDAARLGTEIVSGGRPETEPACGADPQTERLTERLAGADPQTELLAGVRPATRVAPGAPRRAGEAPASSSTRAALADASASAAERLADPAGALRAGPDARRTVEITGRPGALAAFPRLREIERHQRSPRAVGHRFAANPDRIAMWAVLLGILLVLIAFTSGSAGAVAMPLLSAL